MPSGAKGGKVPPRRVKQKALPSASPIGALAALPSGDAAPGARPDVGHAHEGVGMPGVHAMAVPGMPTREGGNLQGHGNPIQSRGTTVPVSTPRGVNQGNRAEPTNPRLAPPDGQGNGGVGEVTGAADTPPGMAGTPLVNIAPPSGSAPNNPRGEVLNDYPARMRRGIGSGS